MRRWDGRLALAVLTIAIVPHTSLAEHDGIDPCKDATTQLELAYCWSDAAAESEAQVNQRLANLQAAISETGDTRLLGLLEQGHNQWLAYINTHCSLYGARYEGGSAQTTAEAICRYRLSEHRASELDGLLDEWTR